MPEYICPLCLLKHSQAELDAWPCCAECNCDLPGDVELTEISKFIASNSAKSLIKHRDVVQNAEATEAFKSKLLRRIDELTESVTQK